MSWQARSRFNFTLTDVRSGNPVRAPAMLARLPNASLIAPPLRSTAVTARCRAVSPLPMV